MQYVLFQGNNCYANAPKCFVYTYIAACLGLCVTTQICQCVQTVTCNTFMQQFVSAAKCSVFTSTFATQIHASWRNPFRTPTGFSRYPKSERSVRLNSHISTCGILRYEFRQILSRKPWVARKMHPVRRQCGCGQSLQTQQWEVGLRKMRGTALPTEHQLVSQDSLCSKDAVRWLVG